MKNLLKVMVLAASLTIVAQGVNAKEYYVSGNIGMGKGKSQFNVDTITKTTTGKKTESFSASLPFKADAFTGGIAVGAFITEQFRTELAVDFSKYKLKSNKKGEELDTKIRHSNVRAMVNAYFDIKNDSPVTPYLMGGIGFGKNTIHFKNDEEYKDKLAKSKGSFAWQLGTGVDFAVSDDVKIGLGYRFVMIDTKKHKLSRTTVDTLKNKTTSTVSYKAKGAHMALLSVRYEF